MSGSGATPGETVPPNLRLARDLRRDRRWPEAAYRYRATLEADAACFEAALGLGVVLLELNKSADAIAPLQRAIELDGNSADAHAALGVAHDRLLQWDAAAAAYQASLTLRPADHRTLVNLAGVLSRLDRRGEFDAWIARAVQAEPTSALLLSTQASQHFGFGRLDEAVRVMDRLLALEPGNVSALALLSQMKTFAPDDPHFAALEAAAPRAASLAPDEQIVLHYALGKAYADVGRDEDSFNHYLQANRLQRRTFNYDIRTSLIEFERVKAAFPRELIQSRQGAGDPSARPVFVVGMMRSGTSLVEQILTAHPRVHGTGEMPNFRTSTWDVLSGFPEQVLRAGPQELRLVGEHYLQRIAPGAGYALRVTDKTLSNDLYAGMIHLALPKARIIHVLRDPVDTCLSIFTMNFGTLHPFACDLGELGRYYRAERQMMEHWRRVLPAETLLEIRYEDIVADIEGQTRRMLDFCGLDWDPACLAFDTSSRAVWTASAAQIRRPLFSSSVGRWRPAPAILKPLLDGLGEYAT